MYSIPVVSESIGNNSYRGAPLTDYKSIETAKKAGIKCVIYLGTSADYQATVELCGLKYMPYDALDGKNAIGIGPSLALTDYKMAVNSRELSFYGTEEKFKQKCRLPIENFTKLIKQLNEGYCYIGCSNGCDRTDSILRLVEAFSPRYNAKNLERYDYIILLGYRSLYQKLTEQDKLTMGWDKDFEELFLKKIELGFMNQLGFIPV